MNFKRPYLLWLGLALLLVLVSCEQCKPRDEEFFITFHPHLDAFWLNTDDELKNINFRPQGFLYAMNQRSSKQILNSMLTALQTNQTRKFFVTEIVFFKDWYDTLSSDKKDKVKELLKNGQLEITNGGWVQNDEAVCYMDDILDQYTIGHNFLYQEFGIAPTIAWATDSFGHSHSQAALEHLLGIQIQGIERIDDRYIFQRKGQSLLEFYWSAVSDSNGRRYGGVYTHIRHFLHEFLDYRRMAPQIVANDHAQIEGVMKKMYRRNKLFRFVGNDFEEFAPEEFAVLEKAFINLNSNSHGECKHFKYGNPSDYFKHIRNGSEAVPVRESDFMPNFDQDHYWSGYYTTNPDLKIICKDFSRLVNLFRKLYTKHLVGRGSDDSVYRTSLVRADELLAVMQHHDGITATSKYHIEQLFKRRMKTVSDDLIRDITKLKSKNGQVCSLYTTGNKCSLGSATAEVMYLTILHEGAPKIQRIQISLPANIYYEAEEDSEDSIFCSDEGACVLVFNAYVKAGENVFKFNKIGRDREQLFVSWKAAEGSSFSANKFSVEINNAEIKYTLNSGQFIYLSFVRSANNPTNVDTMTWNKFGDPIRKNERRIAGIYIMANNGQIQFIPDLKFTSLKVAEGRRYSKISVVSVISNTIITIDNKQLNIIDVQSTFKPNTWQMFDYFLKIDSNVKSDGPYYHDMNGFLVSKRRIGQRLDYQWNYRKDDKINANTYPICSFGYVYSGDQKMVIFTDRAQGFTQFDSSLLVNIDRLAGDDYKGVGQGYTKQINNTFKFKIGVVPKDNNIQRLWQRQYDQPLLGYISEGAFYSSKKDENAEKKTSSLLKYTIFSLNQNEFVLRLFNLGEKQLIKIPKYEEKQWKLEEIGLDLTYEDIRQAFANGIPLGERKIWKKIPDEINVFTAGSKDTHQDIALQPLQIRSFRVNLKDKIPVPEFTSSPPPPAEESTLTGLTLADIKPLKKSPFARRCF